jgi:rhamnulokinase
MMTVVGLNPAWLQPIVAPGSTIGYLTDELAAQTKLGKVPVVAVAGHDTAAAVAAIPAENERFAFLSSGTWSLMGLELNAPIIDSETYRLNYTNEGGADGRTLFMKNHTGMWLLEQCRAAWKKEGHDYNYTQLVDMAAQATPFAHRIDTDHSSFSNPLDMPKAIVEFCRSTGQNPPNSHAAIVRCIFESLALKYKQTFNHLKKVAPFSIEKLNVIGGGAQNQLLNQYISDALSIPVVCGPVEATAIGNIMLQAKASGIINSLDEMRQIIRNSFPVQLYRPNPFFKNATNSSLLT